MNSNDHNKPFSVPQLAGQKHTFSVKLKPARASSHPLFTDYSAKNGKYRQ